MKRKPLRLSKETVRALSPERLAKAGGAWLQTRYYCVAYSLDAGDAICGPPTHGDEWSCKTCPAVTCVCYFYGG